MQVIEKLRMLIDEEVGAKMKDAIVTTVADMNVNPGELMSEERKSQVVYENFARVDEQKSDLLRKFVASLFGTTAVHPGTYCRHEKN
jgi:hypothetical protein